MITEGSGPTEVAGERGSTLVNRAVSVQSRLSSVLAIALMSEPRWSIAAAATTPRELDTAWRPFCLPGVIFIACDLPRVKCQRILGILTYGLRRERRNTEGTEKPGRTADARRSQREKRENDDYKKTTRC